MRMRRRLRCLVSYDSYVSYDSFLVGFDLLGDLGVLVNCKAGSPLDRSRERG